ncbi:MAG: hypothetical protein FWD17_01680 [Polyangiaceae bacterium]|nr:hypothetical protein [Polyangiaceae bacterium]
MRWRFWAAWWAVAVVAIHSGRSTRRRADGAALARGTGAGAPPATHGASSLGLHRMDLLRAVGEHPSAGIRGVRALRMQLGAQAPRLREHCIALGYIGYPATRRHGPIDVPPDNHPSGVPQGSRVGLQSRRFAPQSICVPGIVARTDAPDDLLRPFGVLGRPLGLAGFGVLGRPLGLAGFRVLEEPVGALVFASRLLHELDDQ